MTEPTLSILAIGDELLTGDRTDTNSAWIAARATDQGIRVAQHRTVGDDAAGITRALRELAASASVVITTGGLGPTPDDLLREALASLLNEELVEDPGALAAVRAWFLGRAEPMPETNAVQALRPASARCLPNPNGTAPGLSLALGSARVFCLPGPPREMRPMFERDVAPAITPDGDRVVRARLVPTFGLGESAVAARLGDLMDRARNPLVGTTASGCIVTCRVRFTGPPAEAEARLDETVAEIKRRLGPAVLADHDEHDDGLALVRAVFELLHERKGTVATVESCTGGLLGQMLTRLSGAGDVFSGGLLTYTNELKTSLAGVDPDLIKHRGAVSREVALAMAEGGLQRTGAAHALAITGIAGPTGAVPGKPVGTVWIARASEDRPPDVRRFLFRGGRDAVRLWSASTALGMLRIALTGADAPLLGQSE